MEQKPTATHIVPGVVVTHSPAASRQYIGSPSLAILPQGAYVATHDFFGSGTNHDTSVVYQSQDRGRTWQRAAELVGQWWSTLFLHRGALYLLGTTREYGQVVIRRSDDGGRNWSQPGLLSKNDRYHCAPVPVVEHQGRLWRAFELAHGQRPQWRAQVLSAPAEADLLQPENWRYSREYEHLWSHSQWIEGNVVVTPQGDLVNMLRTNAQGAGWEEGADRAALLHISADGQDLYHDREQDLIDFPGGGVKFTVRFDPTSRRYWSLGCQQKDPPANRNRLVLTSSADLYTWRVESVVLHHPDPQNHAFQYVDWLFDGDDLAILSRTAYDDGLDGAHNGHDANYLTFHRLADFRGRTLDQPPLA
ncbi:MAG: exo-alpha-sialidase [Candidatus Latescibacteria bacterium]|nr:exo-alpha-sialidase [Candidatus Latescibacterota bacterium]